MQWQLASEYLRVLAAGIRRRSRRSHSDRDRGTGNPSPEYAVAGFSAADLPPLACAWRRPCGVAWDADPLTVVVKFNTAAAITVTARRRCPQWPPGLDS